MSESAPAPELTAGTLLAGRFRVVRCLGMGGMGAVYEIEHELTKHRRALKLLHPEMAQNQGVVERFLREASAAGRVGNPHIVETFDAGTLDTGAPYLVLEFLKGQTLSDRIERGPMPVSEVVDLLSQACEGIEAAHQAGIVHRDLKPDNLFVTEEKGCPFVKILDFGISKFDPGKTGGLALTQEGAALGTPYYMSPEQIRGELTLDARTDVYALGVILYECLAGRRPFDADTLTHLAVLIHAGNPPPLSGFRRDLPSGLEAVVARAMHTDAAQRIPSAAALRKELERYRGVALDETTALASVVSGAPPVATAVSAQSLGTSAAGVSLHTAAVTAGEKKRSGAVAIALVALAAVGVAAAAFLRQSAPSPSAEPAPARASAPAAIPVVGASGSALPEAMVAPTLAPPAPVPSDAPGAPTPGTKAVASAGSSATAAATTATSPSRTKKARDPGLAHDNPFR